MQRTDALVTMEAETGVRAFKGLFLDQPPKAGSPKPPGRRHCSPSGLLTDSSTVKL